MKRKPIHFWILLAILLLVLALTASGSHAQAGDPYSLIDAVNTLRLNNGLPPYEVNSILMSIAQGQSDYQASIGTGTHVGPGGTDRIDRARAAGYGGGGTIFVSENICWGTDQSVEQTIDCWLQDEPHIQTMLGPNYHDVGAGVAVGSDGVVYYTLDAGYVAGSGNYVPPAMRTPGGPTAIPYFAVQTVTPMPDGSIVHTVQLGQNLSIIAKGYGLTVAEIKELNNLSSDNIYVGNKLLIRKAGTPGPTATSTATSTSTRAATPTRKPTRTPTPSVTPSVTATQAVLAQAVSENKADGSGGSVEMALVMTIVIMMAGGVILMVVGSLLKRRKNSPAS